MSRVTIFTLFKQVEIWFQRHYSAFEFGAFFAGDETSRDSAVALQAALVAWTWRDARRVSIPRAPIVFCSFLASPGLHLESPGWEGIAAACRREKRRETPQRQKCLLPSSPRTKIPLRMADDNHENGTTNGDVPEIELIIKVSVPRAVVIDG